MQTPLPELPRGIDLFSSYGAGLLAKHIEAYWRARGFAGVRAERFELGVGDAFGVRSNLVNGYPPKQATTFVPELGLRMPA